jgi:hypothetical protein
VDTREETIYENTAEPQAPQWEGNQNQKHQESKANNAKTWYCCT